MIIEITGAGFHNMGAELMLLAARDAVTSWPFVEDVAINFRIGSNAQRRDAGLGSVVAVGNNRSSRVRRAVEMGVRATPTRLLQTVGAHRPDGMDALLDASGFAFGDQWGPNAAESRAALYEPFAHAGKPIVLLPQAFGPFRNADAARASRRAINMADLVFARDPESLSHLEQLDLAGPDVGLASDFTNLIDPPSSEGGSPTVTVIPNYRVPEKLDSVDMATYVQFLNACIGGALESGHDVLVLAHEAGDARIAQQLVSDAEHPITVAGATGAVATKALVGESWLTISSRYHGAVNALSQCVPTIGTSWSHKYTYLFEDYHCADGLWPIDASVVPQRLGAWLADDGRQLRARNLEEPAAEQKEASRAMWRRVEKLLRGGL